MFLAEVGGVIFFLIIVGIFVAVIVASIGHKKKVQEAWVSIASKYRIAYAHADAIDVALFLEPCREDVSVRLLKDHDNPRLSETHLHLHCDTLRLVENTEEQIIPPRMPASRSTSGSGTSLSSWNIP